MSRVVRNKNKENRPSSSGGDSVIVKYLSQVCKHTVSIVNSESFLFTSLYPFLRENTWNLSEGTFKDVSFST